VKTRKLSAGFCTSTPRTNCKVQLITCIIRASKYCVPKQKQWLANFAITYVQKDKNCREAGTYASLPECIRGLHGLRLQLNLAWGLGLGLVAQIIFGFRSGSNDSNQTAYRIFPAFLGHSFYHKEMLFIVTHILCSWHSAALETNPTDLFSR
jgi:hypothetical protein